MKSDVVRVLGLGFRLWSVYGEGFSLSLFPGSSVVLSYFSPLWTFLWNGFLLVLFGGMGVPCLGGVRNSEPRGWILVVFMCFLFIW